MLIVMPTVLFLLCTIHVGASLRQLLDAFAYAPTDVPDYSTVYWLDYTTIPYALKGNLYATLVRTDNPDARMLMLCSWEKLEGAWPRHYPCKVNITMITRVLSPHLLLIRYGDFMQSSCAIGGSLYFL